MRSITLKTLRRRTSLEVADEITLGELRERVGEATSISSEQLKIVRDGRALSPENGVSLDTIFRFQDGDTLIVMVAPKAPPKHVVAEDGDVAEEEDDLKFRLPESATPLQKGAAHFLSERLHFPDFLLLLLFSIRRKTWMLALVWVALAAVAGRYQLGPIYLIGSLFAIIFLNLGRRQEGELSAYSWFNPDCQELPGTLNAERLDRDIRAGQF